MKSAAAVLAVCLLAPGASGARDRGADGHFEKRESSHFVLYQDVDIDRTSGLRGSRNFENQVLDTLEQAYDDLDRSLGLRPSRPIDVVIYDPSVFDAQFAGAFRFAAAGFYSGTIHVRGDTVVRAPLVRTLHHELVHAAWAAEAPSLVLPGWFNEGVAEWFEARAVGKRQLSPQEAGVLSQLAREGQLFSFWDLSFPSFSHLDGSSARAAYLQSYGFVEYLAREHGDDSLRRLCTTLLRKRNLDRALSLTFRDDLDGLATRFASEYGGSLGG
jgi:hypothetical protein